MCNYHKAGKDMYYPPESADHRYDVRFTFISYFLTEAFRPDTPPITHNRSDPAVSFQDARSLSLPSGQMLSCPKSKEIIRVRTSRMLHTKRIVDVRNTTRVWPLDA